MSQYVRKDFLKQLFSLILKAWSTGRLQHVPLLFVPNLLSTNNNINGLNVSSSNRLVVQPDFDASFAYGAVTQQRQQQQMTPTLFSTSK